MLLTSSIVGTIKERMELGEKVLEQERYYHPSVFENGKNWGH